MTLRLTEPVNLDELLRNEPGDPWLKWMQVHNQLLDSYYLASRRLDMEKVRLNVRLIVEIEPPTTPTSGST